MQMANLESKTKGKVISISDFQEIVVKDNFKVMNIHFTNNKIKGSF